MNCLEICGENNLKKLLIQYNDMRIVSFVPIILLPVAFLGGFYVQRFRSQKNAADTTAAGNDKYWLRRVDQFKALGHNEKIVVMGDSRVNDGEWSEWLGVPVSNRGIGGETVSKTVRRIDESLPNRAQVVFAEIGINDIQFSVPKSDILRNYGELIQKLKTKADRVVVCSVTQVGDSRSELGEQVNAVNAGIKELATQQKVEWLDLNPKICVNGYLDKKFSPDGIHYSGELYQIYARAFKEKINTTKSADGDRRSPHL